MGGPQVPLKLGHFDVRDVVFVSHAGDRAGRVPFRHSTAWWQNHPRLSSLPNTEGEEAEMNAGGNELLLVLALLALVAGLAFGLWAVIRLAVKSGVKASRETKSATDD